MRMWSNDLIEGNIVFMTGRPTKKDYTFPGSSKDLSALVPVIFLGFFALIASHNQVSQGFKFKNGQITNWSPRH